MLGIPYSCLRCIAWLLRHRSPDVTALPLADPANVIVLFLKYRWGNERGAGELVVRVYAVLLKLGS